MQTIVTAAAAFLVTVLAGLILDFLRNLRPKISYSVTGAVPIDLGDHKTVGAYLVSIVNKSRRAAKELTCHVEAGTARLRNGGISAPKGMPFDVEETKGNLKISVPYLKKDETLEITVIAEGIFIPKKPDVAIRSPNEIRVVAEETKYTSSLLFVLAFAGLVAAAVVAVTSELQFTNSQGDVLTFAASVSGLPRLAEMYAMASNTLEYFQQGDLAYALAMSADRSEISKYQKLLSVVIDSSTGMEKRSRANLFYSLGKIDLLLGDRDKAVRDFREAISYGRSVVADKSSQESAVHDFLTSNALN